ncbi:MAG TPA: CDP-alcohol phosphatidyltransferase family protein [Acidimicrobiales bacterium]|nr:CDP-alcohol phosphatidyltransferase family protein [Acidimicrobiales bacterium]
MVDADQVELDRLVTVPNVLSVARLALLAVFGVLLFTAGYRVVAALVLGLAGITDFLDGYIARRFHQVSNLGKVLDPTVDRVALTMSVVSIVVYGAIPVWLAVVVLGREVFVTVTVLVLAKMGAKRFDVLWIGKAGTFGLMLSLPLFLGGHGPGTWARVLTDATWFVAVPALLASLASVVAYVPLAKDALAQGRSASLGPTS